MNYVNKTALVTGASSGIGKVFATELAKKGCNLILVARSKDKLEQLAEELHITYSIQTVPLAIDLSTISAAENLAREIEMRGLTVDILVNNAGFGTMGEFHSISPARIQQEIHLNVTSLTELTHVFISPMARRKEGIIINVASMTAFQPAPYMAVYGATKAYVLSFTEALWAEYNDTGVQVIALCPGETQSSFHAVSGTDSLTSKRMQPIDVVNAAFAGLGKKRSHIIVGRKNYMMAQLPRLLPRSTVVQFAKGVFQSALTNK